MNASVNQFDAEQMEFFEAYAPIFEWLYDRKVTFDFAASLVQFFETRGYLTPNQLAAAQRCMDRDCRPAPPTEGIAVQVDLLEKAFAQAKQSGLRWPRITLRGVVVKPAGANSRNPGALYVTTTGDDKTYLGKVIRGGFHASWACSAEQAAEVAALVSDPKGAVEKHGRLTGNCAICSRPLTNGESVARGIGPICAEKFGW